MSLSNVSNRWLNKAYKSIAILLVLFAVIISALRLLLPYAQNYRQPFQDFINETYQTNIKIGSLSMGWQKFGPTLKVNKISILDTEYVEVFVENIDVKVDFWQSLLGMQIVSRDINILGAKVSIDQSLMTDTGDLDSNSDALNGLANLFLKQIEYFSIRDSVLRIQTDKRAHKFGIKNLNWLNDGTRHKGDGDIVVGGLTTNTFKLLLDVKGNKRKDLDGKIYLAAKNVNITPWLEKFFAIENDKTHSEINLETWLTLKTGQIKNIQTVFKDSLISWISQNTSHSFSISNGELFAVIDNKETYRIFSSPMQMNVDGKSWPLLEFDFSRDQDGIFGYVSDIDIGGWADMSPLLNQDNKLGAVLDEMSPTGTIKNLYFQGKGEEQQVVATISDFDSNNSGAIPGIKNLSANVSVNNGYVHSQLNFKDGELDFGKHFLKPIPYRDINGILEIKIVDRGVFINVKDMEFDSPELNLVSDIGITLPLSGVATMSLLAKASDIDVQSLPTFYPHLLMGADLVEYLNEGVQEGHVSYADVLYQGSFEDFPFIDHTGIFVVDAQLENATYAFDNEWPAIQKLNANLNFTNNGMLITAQAGELSGINVKGVTAGIADMLEEELLEVKANFSDTAPEKITALMQQSPLRDSVGESLETLIINGPVSGDFSLKLPLDDTDNAEVLGHVYFDNNKLFLQTPSMDFTNVSGELIYTESLISTKTMSLNWRGMPMNIDITGYDKDDFYRTDIHLNGEWSESQWQQQLPDLLHKYADGEVNWSGDLALNFLESGGFTYNFIVESELEETDIKFPAPYNKPKGVKVPVKAVAKGQSHQSTINLFAGDELSFYGVLDHEKVQFVRTHLVLGNDKMLLPMDGFHITTKLDNASIAQWQPFVFDIIDSIPQSIDDKPESLLIPSPERIRGTVGSLDIFNQEIHNVSFDLLDKEEWWLLRLNAKEARSQIKFYSDWYGKGVEVDADFIHFNSKEVAGINLDTNSTLTNSEGLKNSNSFEPEQTVIDTQYNIELFEDMPPIKLQCDSCKVGKLDLGEVVFDLKRPQAGKLSIDNFVAKRGSSKLNFKGYWQLEEGNSTTQIEGEVSVKNVANELEKLGFVSGIKDSGLKTSFSTHWQGGPHDFNLASLNGDVSAKLSEGSLTEVSDSARIFSLLSLQSLLRKLTLDFRDIFSKGMFYSEIKGDFHLQDGIMYTDNTRMKGAAGDLSVKGNTQLYNGKLDYFMAYKPNLTSSLPAIAWIVTLNPVIALAGIAIDEVVTSNVVSEIDFELTGTVNDPIFKEVNRKNRDISVGRSAPPKFVENTDSGATNTEQKMIEPLKPSSEIKEQDKSDG